MPELRAVVAAFEPFGGRGRNRSWDAVSALDEPGIESVRLPVEFDKLRAVIPSLVARGPRALLLVGENRHTRRVQLERVALNVVHARIPDNSGARPLFAEVIPGAPLALPARWDAAAVRDAAAGEAPTEVSHHAGTFACNASLYLALHSAPPEMAVGFVHVPSLPWPLAPRTARLTRAIRAALLTMVCGHAKRVNAEQGDD